MLLRIKAILGGGSGIMNVIGHSYSKSKLKANQGTKSRIFKLDFCTLVSKAARVDMAGMILCYLVRDCCPVKAESIRSWWWMRWELPTSSSFSNTSHFKRYRLENVNGLNI